MPLNLNNNAVSGVDLNNTEVSEVRLNGQTVFSAQTLPVAFSNLIAWYAFDAATYGGSNTDDVTAIIGGSGDDTAFNGSLNSSPIHQSTGGVTDVNAGATSGAFEFDGNDDSITIDDSLGANLPVTLMFWFFVFTAGNLGGVGMEHSNFDQMYSIRQNSGDINFYARGGGNSVVKGSYNTNEWTHVAGTDDGSSTKLYVNGSLVGTGSSEGSKNPGDCFIGQTANPAFQDGIIDDVRWYNKALSASEISQIYQNTEP